MLLLRKTTGYQGVRRTENGVRDKKAAFNYSPDFASNSRLCDSSFFIFGSFAVMAFDAPGSLESVFHGPCLLVLGLDRFSFWVA
jgi:hypothetical protein